MSSTMMSAVTKTTRAVSLAAVATVTAALAVAPAFAKDYADPNWPCIARKVDQISVGQIWDGPAIDDASGWQNDDGVRKLSAYLMTRRIKVEEAEAAVKKFADGLSAETRDKKLTDLFAGVLSRANDERKIVIAGIERFHKRQMARAAEIEKAGIALPAEGELPTTPMSAGEIDKIPEEVDKYKWEARVFQERQQNIPIACDIPMLIDERAGAIARAIRGQMKS